MSFLAMMHALFALKKVMPDLEWEADLRTGRLTLTASIGEENAQMLASAAQMFAPR